MDHDLGLLVNLSVSLVLALLLGLITQHLRLSPIVGYLLAGIALGPQTPGFVADPKMAAQLAEIGVVLLMFGVGMHFNVGELLAVRRIAVPGAVGQILAATALGLISVLAFGGAVASGFVLGLAISVASTVVLVRVLMDNDALHTTPGHIAVGWLVVEDIFTVFVLVVLPALAGAAGQQAAGWQQLLGDIGWAVAKLAVFGVVIFVGGRWAVPRLLRHVAGTRSRELFTLCVFALALAVATGSAVLFGVSMALGAFLAGMMVGQTEVSHQAAADALPMRDAFAVLFFVSVGMLFDPRVVVEQPGLLLALLGIVLLAKPLTAMLIVWALRYSVRAALTVAVGLAQIGEFSFLLANEAAHHKLLSAEAQSLLVACAIISITLNPLLFRAVDPVERWLRGRRWFRVVLRRSEAGSSETNARTQALLEQQKLAKDKRPQAVVVGYGPVGQTASRILAEFNLRPVVVDLNLDTVRGLVESGRLAIYGDATRREILEAAGIRQAQYLLVTIPEVLTRTLVILAAKDLNSPLRVFVRARYVQERAWLEEVGADEVCTEEAETAIGLATLLLREVGADEARVQQEVERIQRELGAHRPERNDYKHPPQS
jgi:CPA2 family monovalent cation:H+ antiporter-2